MISKTLSGYGLHLRSGIRFKHLLGASEKVQNTGDFQFIVNLQAPFFVLNDTGVFQQGKMPGNSGDIRSDHSGEFADTSLSLGQLIDNEKAGGMSQRFQDSGPEFEFSLDFRIHFTLQLNGYLAI
jgi:hypothetical protein